MSNDTTETPTPINALVQHPTEGWSLVVRVTQQTASEPEISNEDKLIYVLNRELTKAKESIQDLRFDRDDARGDADAAKERIDSLKADLARVTKEKDELKFSPGVTKVGVMAIIMDDSGRVLLGRKARAVSPEFVDKWVAPGGRVNYGESLETATIRECAEEAGVVIQIKSPLPTQQIVGPRFHFVFPSYLCGVVSGNPVAGDDLSEVRWFTKDELEGLPMTPITRASIIDALDRSTIAATKKELEETKWAVGTAKMEVVTVRRELTDTQSKLHAIASLVEPLVNSYYPSAGSLSRQVMQIIGSTTKPAALLEAEAKVYWEYIGEELAIFWENPYGHGKEKIASFLWPFHPPDKTTEVERIFEAIAQRGSSPAGAELIRDRNG